MWNYCYILNNAGTGADFVHRHSLIPSSRWGVFLCAPCRVATRETREMWPCPEFCLACWGRKGKSVRGGRPLPTWGWASLEQLIQTLTPTHDFRLYLYFISRAGKSVSLCLVCGNNHPFFPMQSMLENGGWLASEVSKLMKESDKHNWRL